MGGYDPPWQMETHMTPREQQFVQYILRGKDAAYAAHCSGVRYDCNPTDMRAPHVIADELMQRHDIIEAVGERGEVAVTKELLVADAYEIKERALAQERYSEAINALKLVGDFEGLRAQKVDVTVRKEVQAMTEEELLRIINGGGASGKLLDVTPSKVEVGDG